MSLTGEIVFDDIKFETQNEDKGKLKKSSLINSSAPANLTIKNSNIAVHHNSEEDVDIIHVEDYGE